MMIRVFRVGALLAATTLNPVIADAEPAGYEVGPAATWVQVAPASGNSPELGPSSASGGTEYLLSDSQTRVR